MVSGHENHHTGIRVLMLGVLGFLLSIKSDRYFPLPEHLPEPIFQLVLLPYTLCFLIAVLIFVKPGIVPDRYIRSVSPIRIAAAVALGFEGMTCILLFVQSFRYASFGYRLNIPLVMVMVVATGIALAFVLFQDRSPGLLLCITMVAYGLTYVVSILSFPLHSGRSDMLPLIVAGCQAFLTGITPYGYYDIPHHLVFTYLPGMWLSYLPAVAMNLDPRVINLGCVLASVLLIAYTTRERRERSFVLLSVFVMTPYLQYRHEIYLGVLFLVLSIIYVLFMRNRWLAGSAAFGYALATYQFSWLIFPFSLIHIYRRSGWEKTLLSLAVAVGVALTLILPFLLLSPGLFLEGIYGHWLYVDVPTVNLSYLVSLLVPWDYLVVVQGVLVLLLLLVAVRRMTPRDLWGWMAVALLLFIALNRVIEVYFYLLVLLLLVFHGIENEYGENGGGMNRNPNQQPE